LVIWGRIWRVSMRSMIAVATAALLLWGQNGPAKADSNQLAETGGFLLGNAHRCGVRAQRIAHAGKVIHDLILAAANDPREASAAEWRYAEVFMASASPKQELIPPCGVVITQFDRLERHHHQAGMD
jgi:hypothetical protein